MPVFLTVSLTATAVTKSNEASVYNGQIPTTRIPIPRLRAKVPVLPGKRGGGLVENVVDPKKDLLPDSGAQLV